MSEDLKKYKNKVKKYSRIIEKSVNNEEYEDIVFANKNLIRENSAMREEISQLKVEVRSSYNISHNPTTHQNSLINLSPEWIAHTTNKLANL